MIGLLTPSLTPGSSVGAVGFEEIDAAARIGGRHFDEAPRLAPDLERRPLAIRLNAWLRSQVLANGTDRVPTTGIYQYGPSCARDSRDLRAALAVLAERGRAWLEESGRRRSVVINPALLVNRE